MIDLQERIPTAIDGQTDNGRQKDILICIQTSSIVIICSCQTIRGHSSGRERPYLVHIVLFEHLHCRLTACAWLPLGLHIKPIYVCLYLQYPDGQGRTALHLAAQHNQWAVVYILLDRGASLKNKDENMPTPLHVAAAKGNALIVHLMLRCAVKTGRHEVACSLLNHSPSS